MELKKHLLLLPVLLALCISITGCSSYVAPVKLANSQMLTANHRVAFSPGKTSLSASQVGLLHHFLFGIPSASITYVDIAADDANYLNSVRGNRMMLYLSHYGIDRRLIHHAPPFIALDRDTLLLTVQYSKAISPHPCPDWSKSADLDYNSTDESNFGCAFNHNLAVQLANPDDIQSGHATAQTDAARDSVVIQKYLSDTPMATGASSGSASPSSSGTTASP